MSTGFPGYSFEREERKKCIRTTICTLLIVAALFTCYFLVPPFLSAYFGAETLREIQDSIIIISGVVLVVSYLFFIRPDR